MATPPRAMLMLAAALTSLALLAAAPAQATLAPADTGTSSSRPAARQSTGIPTRAQWLRDVHRAMTRAHAKAYLRQRAKSGQTHLAVNFDIDNTVIQSHFHRGAIPEMLAFTRFAHRLGYAILFNTGRKNSIRTTTLNLLRSNHFRVDALCMRRPHEQLVHSKQRCRRQFIAHGWTLVENIGNNPTDLQGGGYEKGVRLPNYGGRLA